MMPLGPHSRRNFLKRTAGAALSVHGNIVGTAFSKLLSTPQQVTGAVAASAATANPLLPFISQAVASEFATLNLAVRLSARRFMPMDAPDLMFEMISAPRSQDLSTQDMGHFEFRMAHGIKNLCAMADKGVYPLLTNDVTARTLTSLSRPELFPRLARTAEQTAKFAAHKCKPKITLTAIASDNSTQGAFNDYIGTSIGNIATPEQISAWKEFRSLVSENLKFCTPQSLPKELQDGAVRTLHRLFSPHSVPSINDTTFAEKMLTQISEQASRHFDVLTALKNPSLHPESFIWRELQQLQSSTWRNYVLTNSHISSRAEFMDALSSLRISNQFQVQYHRPHQQFTSDITAAIKKVDKAMARLRKLNIKLPAPLQDEVSQLIQLSRSLYQNGTARSSDFLVELCTSSAKTVWKNISTHEGDTTHGAIKNTPSANVNITARITHLGWHLHARKAKTRTYRST